MQPHRDKSNEFRNFRSVVKYSHLEIYHDSYNLRIAAWHLLNDTFVRSFSFAEVMSTFNQSPRDLPYLLFFTKDNLECASPRLLTLLSFLTTKSRKLSSTPPWLQRLRSWTSRCRQCTPSKCALPWSVIAPVAIMILSSVRLMIDVFTAAIAARTVHRRSEGAVSSSRSKDHVEHTIQMRMTHRISIYLNRKHTDNAIMAREQSS